MNPLIQTIATLTAQQKSLIRLVLSGASVIDAPRIYFDSLTQIDRFLRLNQFDISRRENEERLHAIHAEAVNYVENQLNFSLEPAIKSPDDIRKLFLLASETLISATEKPTKTDSKKQLSQQIQACAVLKAMQVNFHIDGHELLYNCPLSRRELAKQVDDKIERELSRLKRSGFPLLSYQGGRKPKESLITKLLCKRSTITSRINDRLRYQMVVREQKDLVNLLVELLENLVPFNCVVAGATTNKLIDPKLFLSSHELVSQKARDVANSIARSVSHLLPHSQEEVNYSSKHYKVLKFVVDMPIRLDPQMIKMAEAHAEELGSIVFSLVEFQIVDEATHRTNQEEESAHDQYKARQKQGVLHRMIGGGS